jgi:DNA-binding phage protein
MAKNSGKRIYRRATESERERHAAMREQIAAEVPAINRRAKERLALLKTQGTPLRQVLAALRAERERQGLSLADINQRSGIDRAALSRLENNEDANPTLATLERYAEAVGKQMVVLLADQAT